MTISYAITVCDELEEITILLKHLLEHKREQDEIVILLDKPKASKQLEVLLEGHAHAGNIVLAIDYFDRHFADWKNKLNSFCKGDYIVNIDADELPCEDFQNYIVEILEDNPEVDMFVVPRWNTVKGLTEERAKRWRWSIDDLGRINWPDYQMRVYKNKDIMKWINPVHEVLTGYNTFAPLPDSMYFNHHKTIERQEKQNKFYGTI